MRIRLAACALLLAASPLAFAASGDAAAGGKKSSLKGCPACHGADGVSPSPDFPNLAGQYADYLETAMRHYKSGKRKNPIMGPQAAPLSQRDIEDLAAYYSHQQGLVTRKNSYLVKDH